MYFKNPQSIIYYIGTSIYKSGIKLNYFDFNLKSTLLFFTNLTKWKTNKQFVQTYKFNLIKCAKKTNKSKSFAEKSFVRIKKELLIN